MDTTTKRQKLEDIVIWLRKKNPRHSVTIVDPATEVTEILIAHKDGGEIQLTRKELMEIDSRVSDIDNDYAIYVSNVNGIPSLSASISI